jgi:Transposase DDE domain
VNSRRELTADDLSNWKLIECFQRELAAVTDKAKLHPTFDEPGRKLGCQSYLSLFLLGLFNPVVESMRSLCAVSGLSKVQQQLGCSKVSLGSFSEAQSVLDPDLLKQVFERLAQNSAISPKADPRLMHLELIAQDGSLWSALPRMTWAEYGVGCKGQAKGVRLHLRFNILKDSPEDAWISQGNGCEAQALRQMLLPGQTNVADRYYGKDYQLFSEIDRVGAFFVFRISQSAVIHPEQELALSPAERRAGILRHGWVRLGATEKLRTLRLRLVEIQHEGQHLLLITNHNVESVPAELVSLIYRRRWSIELFFRWIKCILGCRHFFAESPQGAAIQLYLALIAALLLQSFTGTRPNKRVMEFLRFYMMGWATAQEVIELIQSQALKRQKIKRA